MKNMLIGLAVGVVFAPVWIMLWTNYVKPTVLNVVSKLKTKK